MKELFVYLMLNFQQRGSVKNKTRFINFLINSLGNEGYRLVQDNYRDQGIMNNLIVGDLRTARSVIVAGYDTPQISLIPGFRYYPADPQLTQKQERNQFIARVFVSLLVEAAAIYALIRMWSVSIQMRFAGILLVGVVAVLANAFVRKLYGKGNGNRNTAALALMMSMIEDLGPDNKDTAFIFLDLTASTYKGYLRLQDILKMYHNEKNINLYILECLGKNNEVYVIDRKDSRKLAKPFLDFKDEKHHFEEYTVGNDNQSLVSLFPNALYIVGAENRDGKLVVEGTRSRSDIDADYEGLELISAALKKALKIKE